MDYTTAQNPVQLVHDIWPGSLSAAPNDLVLYQEKVYFVAQDSVNGHRSLWASDGNGSGTEQIFYMPDSLNYVNKSLVVKSDTLFFLTWNDNSHTSTLWYMQDNATEVQPALTFDFFDSYITNFLVFKDKLWFSTADRIGFFDPSLDSVRLFYHFNSTILTFNASTDSLYWFGKYQQNPYVANTALYRSSGAGFQLVYDAGTSIAGTNGSTACDVTMTTQAGKVLWIVQSTSYAPSASYPNRYAVGATGYPVSEGPGNLLLDVAICDSFLLVSSLTSPSSFQAPTNFYLIAEHSNGIIDTLDPGLFPGKFAATTTQVFALSQQALWVTNGTDAGTHLVQAVESNLRNLAPWQNKLLFLAYSNNHDAIWTSNGTADSTYQLAVLPDYVNPLLNPFLLNDCTLLFTLSTAAQGRELWKVNLPPCAPLYSATMETNDDFQVTLSPNPTTGNSYLQMAGNVLSNWQAMIFDRTGRRLWQGYADQTQTVMTLPSEYLPGGIYFVLINQKEKYKYMKLIVQY